jgi:hypothetical protein
VICSERILDCFADDYTQKPPPFLDYFWTCVPSARILAIAIQGTIGLSGYAYYQDGNVSRVRASTLDDGVFLDVGQRLPEELPVLAELLPRRISRDGRKYVLEGNMTREEAQMMDAEDFEIAAVPEHCYDSEYVEALAKNF